MIFPSSFVPLISFDKNAWQLYSAFLLVIAYENRSSEFPGRIFDDILDEPEDVGRITVNNKS
jgi:hypothetical protein